MRFRLGPWLLRGALGASLVLNIVLGLLLYRMPDRGPDIRRMQAHIEKSLSDADRAAFRQALEAGRTGFDPLLRAMRQSPDLVAAALRREPFDAAALRGAMAEGRERWRAFSTVYENSLVDGFAAISPEGRRRIAEDIEQRRRKAGDRRN